MRNKAPLRWIESAEARRVLTAVLFERSPDPSWRKVHDAVRPWLPQFHFRLYPSRLTGSALRQVKPGLGVRPIRPCTDDSGGSGNA